VGNEPYFSAEPVSWGPAPQVRFIRPPRSAWIEYGIPALLFGITATTIYRTGGLRFVLAVMGIMLSHEMGHYLACRYYRMDATLPHFLPGPTPPFGLIGTFGAFIRIRSPFPTRKILFDVGVAGPLAGIVACLPVLYLAAQELIVVPVRPGEPLLNDPLLLRYALEYLAPTVTVGPNEAIVAGPYTMAAWFGMFLTAINLMPVGQLDGGHAMYALFRDRARLISRIASWLCLGLLYFGPTYLLWWILIRWLGSRPHPPTLDDEQPLGRARVVVALICAAVFVLCFRPDPFVFSWSTLARDAWEWMTT
jgi:membrane-associated protease RseP (regulator of RpoE activity)